jgi:chromosome segregation ATPase
MKNGREADTEVNQLARQLGVDPNDPIVLIARGNAKLEARVDAWTQTNLQLLELLTLKSEETDRLARNYNKLTTLLSGLDGQLQGLQQQIEVWKESSPVSGYNQNPQALQKLNQATSTVHEQLVRLTNAVKKLQTVRSAERDWDWVNKLGFRLLVVGLCVGVGAIYWKAEYVARRSEWTMIKLERLEQRLGTE